MLSLKLGSVEVYSDGHHSFHDVTIGHSSYELLRYSTLSYGVFQVFNVPKDCLDYIQRRVGFFLSG